MRYLKGLIIVFFIFSGIASAQNLAWKENSSFSINSASSSIESNSQLSYLLSYNTLPINKTGFVEISNFLLDGQAVTAQSELESVSIFLTFENSFSLSRVYQHSYSITYSTIDINGTKEKSIKIQGPDGEIAKIENINLNNSDTFRIEKTDVNKIVLRYNSNEYLITDNYFSDARVALFSNTEKLSFDVISNGFSDIDPNPSILVLDDDRNWISVKTYDNAGLLNTASINYFNSLGKSEQRQSRDLKTNRTWVDETRYDSQGRPALQTFSSPLAGTPQHFQFKEGFLKKMNGDDYTTSDFEYNPERPAKASTDIGTVGWYYSNNNSFEPYQDEADNRPYINTVYDELNPGVIRASVGGKTKDVNDNGNEDGLLDEFPQGYSYTMPAAQELYYVFGKNYFPGEINPTFGKKATAQFFKTVVTDAQGNESVIFKDKDGKVWASAKSGEGQGFEVVSIIGEQGFVDVHIPKNVSNISFMNGTGGYSVYNLRTGKSVSPSQVTGGNVYRIESSPGSNTSGIWISSNGGISALLARGIRYNVNYHDFSLNYYDKAGHLKKTIQPLGFNSSCISGSIQDTVNHAVESRFHYNASGELLSSTSPDEGSSKLIYRSDGQIRFSRNTEQVLADEFSYTNYDDKGRPVESGVSTAPNPFFPSVIEIDPTLTAESDVMASTGSLSKSGRSSWSDSGFTSSENTGPNNFDISFQFLEDKEGVVGISETNSDGNYQTVDYGMYFMNNQITIINNGASLIRKAAYYSDNDVFHIERNSNTLYFKKNNQIIYQLDAWPANQDTYPKYVIDGALYTNQATVSNMIIFQLTDVPSTPPSPDNWEVDPNSCKEQVFTLYDVKDTENLHDILYDSGTGTGPSSISYRTQRFVAGNVSKTYTKNPETTTTWYSYDIYGRVEWMVQFINGLGAKTIDYYYDDASGQISKVIYQRDEPSERFVHKYLYNEVKQLLTVETSRDNINFTEHAKYFYYETGELKRVELAEGLQGTDYVYTLNGQLKAINHSSLSDTFDPGEDQNDAFALKLDYHSKDYTRAGTNIGASQTGIDRYDGNIKTTRWATEGLNTGGSTNYFKYTYNNNNWLQSATFGSSSFQNNPPTGLPNYSLSNVSYDANGNILSLNRTKAFENGTNAMDDLQYNYKSGKNQLEYVTDSSGNNENDGDIKTQSPENYVYNKIGQLVENKQDSISYSYWTSGLVKSVVTTTGTKEGVYFKYNDRGQRVLKTSANSSGLETNTYYVRDASGQVMAIYNKPPLSGPISVEYPIYGMSRVGMATPGNIFTYELTDHLGNVRAVIQRDAYLTPVLFDDFSGTLQGWIYSQNTVASIDDERLKVTVDGTSTLPNYLNKSFSVTAGHTYSVRFEVDLDETVNGLNYNVTDGSSGPSTISMLNYASENGEYTFNFNALNTGTMYLNFSLSSNEASFGNNNYYLDNVKITDVTTENTPIMLARKDYYPFGMPMPDRNVEGNYRYAYQGQEKDPETGMEAFELRLWDARIGRWLTVDPMGEFHSPYLGMGNNPISLIDPTGGMTDCDGCPPPIQLDEVVITGSGGGGGLQSLGHTAGWLFNPLTSFRVDDLAREAGVQGQGIVFQRQVGAAFENHALNSFNLSKNSIRFPAPGRAARGGRPTVVPDGVRSVKVFGSNGKSAVYPASSFFEVKKRQGIISLKSDAYQTLGIVDAAANSAGGRVGIGSVTFVTTSNTIIGQDVLKYAQKHGVQVYQAVAFEYRKSGRVTYTPAIKLTINKNPSFPNPLISWPTKLKF